MPSFLQRHLNFLFLNPAKFQYNL